MPGRWWNGSRSRMRCRALSKNSPTGRTISSSSASRSRRSASSLCLVLLLMAATSHDYWLELPGPAGVEGAAHGASMSPMGSWCCTSRSASCRPSAACSIPLLLGGSSAVVALLHVIAGWRERAGDRGQAVAGDGWLAVGPPQSIPDKGARIVTVSGGERIAVYRDGQQIGALTNLCAHQNGPIGEGRIIDGLVTCPWHGYQYRLVDGCAPPPFTEKLVTYRVRITTAWSRSIRARCRRAHARRSAFRATLNRGVERHGPRTRLDRRRRADELSKIVVAADEGSRMRRIARLLQGRCQFGAISNACNHVGGPLGEGRLDEAGYIQCPWHWVEIPPLHGTGRTRFRGRLRALLPGEGRERPRAGRRRQSDQAPQKAARAASAGARSGTRARSAALRRDFNHRHGRTRARAFPAPIICSIMRSMPPQEAGAETKLITLNDLKFRALRGLFLQESAVPAPGPARSPRWIPMTSSTRSMRRWCIGPTRSSSRRRSAGAPPPRSISRWWSG